MKRLRTERGRPGAAPSPKVSGDAPRVLYVEDDPDNWSVAQLHLGHRFRLEWARSDAEACTAIREHGAELAVVLLDIELRDSNLSGLDLARLFRGQPPAVPLPDYARDLPAVKSPIFFLTAYSTRYKESDAIRAGGDRLLYKPVNFGELSLALSASQVRQISPGMLRLLEALRRGNASALEEMSVAEPTLVEGWLKLASFLPKDAGPFPGLTAAVERLGVTTAVNLGLGMTMIDMAPARSATEVLLGNMFRRAVAAGLLGQHLGIDNTAEAFALGLLLESGLAARAFHDFDGALEVCRSPAAVRPLREKGAGEVEHPARGSQTLETLNADPVVVEAVAGHHDADPRASALARVAWLAEKLAGVHETGSHARLLEEATLSAERCGVDKATTIRIVESLPAEVERLGRLTGRPAGPQRSLAELLRDSTPSLLALDESYSALVQKLAKLVGEKDALVLRLSQTRDELAERAATDDLTGIANHRALLAAARRDCALAARTSQPIALILADVDHFKKVNDTYGHPAGDAVLKHIANVLSSGMRSGDLAARYGGEEFALLLPQTGTQGAKSVAERLREAMEASRIQVGDQVIPVTASFGVAAFEGKGTYAFEDLIRSADGALYAAKGAGRNCVRVVTEIVGSA